jgi:hypothetical protein
MRNEFRFDLALVVYRSTVKEYFFGPARGSGRIECELAGV